MHFWHLFARLFTERPMALALEVDLVPEIIKSLQVSLLKFWPRTRQPVFFCNGKSTYIHSAPCSAGQDSKGTAATIPIRAEKTGKGPRPHSNLKYNSFAFMYCTFWLQGKKKKSKKLTNTFKL